MSQRLCYHAFKRGIPTRLTYQELRIENFPCLISSSSYVFHCLIFGTIAEWIKAFVSEFSDLVIMSSIAGLGSVYFGSFGTGQAMTEED